MAFNKPSAGAPAHRCTYPSETENIKQMNTEPCVNLWGCNLHISRAASSILERHEVDSLLQFPSARTFKSTGGSFLSE